VQSIVFDECQELRHRGTQKYEAAEMIAHSCDYRLGLSATPIYNYGGEIWNVCNILCPDTLGTWEEFSREWCEFRHDKYVIDNPAAFGVYARETGVMLRRTRKEVQRELPGIIRVPQWIQTDPEAFKKLKGQAIELAKLILRQNQDYKGQKMQAAGEFDMKMRQATGIAKAPFVADFVRFLVEENGTPVVLYGWHRDVYEIWLEKLHGAPLRGIANLNPVMYTGTESPKQKEWAKQEFISGRSKVMIISLRAGAGMDGLQEQAHVCVFGELDWSPGVHEQCEGRLHRDGQDEPVTSYYLLADEGSDPVMSDVLGVKKQQIEGIRDPNQELVTKLQVDPEHIKKLAEKYLTDHNIPLPEKAKKIDEEAV
jgi:SNF2 family DNA or RNA helicase